ncbi:ARF GUANINE NUCLEOTIDE EXCHANGE FACTOR [Encephalitozoon cuniculi GB-M1]|uniref:ARF GUANINE NUCLEOTIDE EXCHANGE FACTOR n=1 Tax=Encephalitozoon cuniculi (strain GB-M1) TaxID=284813 RepID=Q8SR27_ENCCU|nr:Arf family guanine nucleotide exchange factor [Encephalitozoon cuniculi GB-M1]CAD25833.1 ARF GUANINE NUCLEOTIDE EXCHANGE FACTOR [Encephalitozoon cuniculi GB-M1]
MDEHKQKLREIQILLHRLFASHNKETRRILDGLPAHPTPASVLDTFELLFSLSKYSNREMLCFLDAFQRFIPVCRVGLGEIGGKIANLKFTPSEKDTDHVILKYFEIVNTVAEDISEESSKSVFSRYMFILSNSVVSRGVQGEVLKRFREFLMRREGFLRFFASKKMYKEIGCTEDSIVDFCELFNDEEMVGVALEYGSLRGLAIDRTRSRYLFQMYYRELPMWYIAGMHESLIPYLYYAFDGVGIYRSVSAEVYGGLSEQEIMKAVDNDMKSEVCPDECSVCVGGIGHQSTAEQELGIAGVREDIRRFNETGSLEHMIERYGKSMTFEFLRYFEETDLKKLGGFLCKLKNEDYLRIFTGTFDFLDMDILDGLRTYLLSFHLSAEGQIIHRVVEAYADKYYSDNVDACTFMDITRDKRTKEFVFNLAFSFLVLNTKFHNPNVKAKPTFRDYMKDFTAEEIPPSFSEEYLESMYQSVKKRPLEFPAKNHPSREHYKIFKRMCRNLKQMEAGRSEPGVMQAFDPEMPGSLKICKQCRMGVHRKLFSSNFRRFLSLEPRTFHQICSRLDVVRPFEEYLEAHRENIPRFIESFTYYFGMNGRVDLYVKLLDVLAKIDGQKNSGVLSDLRISFLKNTAGKDRVQQQYRDAYKELISAEVLDVGLVCDGLRIFLSGDTSGRPCGEEEEGLQRRRQRSVGFVRKVVVDILKKNIARVEDLSMLDGESIAALMEKCVEIGDKERFCRISRFATSEGLLGLFRQTLEGSPGFVDDEVLEVFKGVPVHNEDGFRCILLLQNNGVDMFDFVVTVKYESIVCRAINAREGEDGEHLEQSKLEFSARDTLSCYTIEEKYGESLSSPSNLFHFYVSSGSVLNQAKARSIHRSGCPLGEKLFSPEEMDRRLIYMVRKADSMDSKDITNYALWIVNLLSSSLPLLSKFFVRNFGLLLTLKNQAMLNSFIKIFYSRVCKVMNGAELCCSCEYTLLDDVEKFIEMAVKYDLASEKDFEFYFDGKSEMIKSGRIRTLDGSVELVRGKAGEGNEDGCNGGAIETGPEGTDSKMDVETNPDFDL